TTVLSTTAATPGTPAPFVGPGSCKCDFLTFGYRLPAISMFAEFARGGGLLSYGPNLLVAAHQAGFMTGKVLAGKWPGILPIERPSKFELLVNSRAADALNIKMPASIQARADEVIE